jgi:hypothetical protein
MTPEAVPEPGFCLTVLQETWPLGSSAQLILSRRAQAMSGCGSPSRPAGLLGQLKPPSIPGVAHARNLFMSYVRVSRKQYSQLHWFTREVIEIESAS